MNGWNYRVCKRKYELSDKEEIDVYDIREIYYDEEGKPNMYSVDPMHITGNDFEELKRDFELYSKAIEKNVIDLDELDRELEEK